VVSPELGDDFKKPVVVKAPKIRCRLPRGHGKKWVVGCDDGQGNIAVDWFCKWQCEKMEVTKAINDFCAKGAVISSNKPFCVAEVDGKTKDCVVASM